MTAPKTVADVLDAAADLLTPEGAWTQKVFARNAAGEDTGLSGHRGQAVCWCIAGATDLVAGEDDLWLSCRADRAIEAVLPDFTSVSAWNDAPGRTQAEVIAKLREAASLARATASLTQGDGQ